jgi:type I restriction enzyme S subunit
MADDKKPKEQQDLPEGWKWVRLGEIVEIYDNKRIPLSEEERANRKGIYPYCGANGIIDYIDSYIFEGEFVLLAEDGGFFGKFEESAYLMTGEFWVNNHAHVLKAKKGVSVNRFILAWLIFDDISRYISGTTRHKLNQSVMKNILVPLPPLSEQRKIAQILETVDNAIEKTEKIIEKYKRIKQGLMQDLLTKGIDEKGNIRSEKTHKFKDSPLGRIPEEWEVVRLGEIVEIYDNKRIPLSEEERANRKGIYPYCGANGIIDHIDNYIFEGDYLLLAEDGGFFGRFENSAYLMSGKFWVNNHAHVLKAREGVSVNRFILAWLIFDDISRYISGTTRQKLNQSVMRNILIPLPPLSEQKRIAEILSQIDQAIEKEEKYKEKLERLKKGLMEDLLTGKVRVNKLLEGENHEMA